MNMNVTEKYKKQSKTFLKSLENRGILLGKIQKVSGVDQNISIFREDYTKLMGNILQMEKKLTKREWELFLLGKIIGLVEANYFLNIGIKRGFEKDER